MTKKTPLIQLQNINFKYVLEDILEDVSLEIAEGDFVGILGPNGSGKTTLLRIILGLLKPQQGSVALFGQPLAHFHQWYRIGYVPQRVMSVEAQFPVTVREVVAQGRFARVGLFRYLNKNDRQVIEYALEAVNMVDFRDRPIRELSGGQQQRVLIARALASEPELLILDEPTAGVDVQSQEEFYQLLSQLKQAKALTLVMVSHDVDVVVNEVNQLVCINKRLVYQGSPKRFIKGEYLEKLYGQERTLILHDH